MRQLARGCIRFLRSWVREIREQSLGEYERVHRFGLRSVGDQIRLTGRVDFGSEPFLISLGSRLTIADGVRFLTHDGGVGILRDSHPGIHLYAPITVEDDVFIGVNAIILPGVTIGRRSVIGAGSVVTRDVPPGTVVAGVPARPLRSIDEYEQRALPKAMFWTGDGYGPDWKTAVIKHVAAAAQPDPNH